MKNILLIISITLTLNTFSQTPGGGVSDVDGNNYSTVIIGSQEWMAENLRTTSYANGDPIPNVIDGTQWANLNTGAWVHYNNDSQYENPYCKLYNWYTVNDSRNVCPAGWHVPSYPEWTVLSDYLGGESVSGGKMKSTGTQYWQSPNQGATNESGFSGLPGGFRESDINGTFNSILYVGYWWSSTEGTANYAWGRGMFYFNGNLTGNNSYTKTSGYSIRCLGGAPLGLIELNGSTLTLSPNPVQDFVSILVDSKLIGEEFTIVDQLGAIVLKGIIKSDKMEIDLSKYSSGMYLFRLNNYSDKVIRILKK
jgi:uncharacterized protein (TIGR02145 family)